MCRLQYVASATYLMWKRLLRGKMRRSNQLLGVQLCFRRFFSEIRGFIVKNWLYIYDSKYCPSLATTFSHLSGSARIPRRKNWSSFEAIHESIQFFTSS